MEQFDACVFKLVDKISPLTVKKPNKNFNLYLYVVNTELIFMSQLIEGRKPLMIIGSNKYMCFSFRAMGNRSKKSYESPYLKIYIASLQGLKQEEYFVSEIFQSLDHSTKINYHDSIKVSSIYRCIYPIIIRSEKKGGTRVCTVGNIIHTVDCGEELMVNEHETVCDMIITSAGYIHINPQIHNCMGNKKYVGVDTITKFWLLESNNHWTVIC